MGSYNNALPSPPAKQRIVWQLSIVIFILLLLMKKIKEKSFRNDSFRNFNNSRRNSKHNGYFR